LKKLLVLLLSLGLLTACGRLEQTGEAEEAADSAAYQLVAVTRRDIRVAVEAAGIVEPVTTVEVKSKASGEILELKVDTGDEIELGTLLARIDQRVLNNSLQQAKANLEVARARLTNAESQRERINSLYENKSVSQSDWETSILEYATANSDVVTREIQVENAQIQLSDSDVKAPITGTIIERLVEQGQVISSPMGDVGGGTLLMKMADLARVRVRMLVDEIDIGKVQPGVMATVNVAAYANRPFQGEVIKVEPQAVEEQNVTMFPVLIDIENVDRLLKPGMNAEVEVLIADRPQALSVPTAALRTQADVFAAASVLGYDMDETNELLAAAPALPAAEGGSTRPAGAAEGMSAEEAAMMAKIRAKFQSGERPNSEEMAFLRKMREKSGGEGFGPGRGRPGMGGPGRARRSASNEIGGEYIVFAMRDANPVPLRVRTGITDMDHSEIVAGLEEDDEVLILPSASLINAQQAFKERMSGRMGIPGLSSRGK
jgi:HlyD family secretion protein